MDSPSGTLAERRLGLAVGALFSLPIGVLSGFTGVGGGEYRAPVLLTLLGRVRWVIAANLLIGLFVAVFNVVFRQAWTLNLDFLVIALLLVPTSLPGAWLGALITNRISTPILKGLLAGILVATGLRLILFEVRVGGALSFDPPRIALALALGFGLGLISGLLGVAGGEYRIRRADRVRRNPQFPCLHSCSVHRTPEASKLGAHRGHDLSAWCGDGGRLRRRCRPRRRVPGASHRGVRDPGARLGHDSRRRAHRLGHPASASRGDHRNPGRRLTHLRQPRIGVALIRPAKSGAGAGL